MTRGMFRESVIEPKGVNMKLWVVFKNGKEVTRVSAISEQQALRTAEFLYGSGCIVQLYEKKKAA